MARDLKLNVDGNSGGAQRALEEAALAADAAARAANHLGDEFNKAKRDAAGLDRQLLETAVAAKALAKELAKNPADAALKKQLTAQKKVASELKNIRKDLIGDAERAAKDAEKVAGSAAKEFGKLTASAAKDAEKLASDAAKEFEKLGKSVGQTGSSIGDLFSGGGGPAAGATIGVPLAIGAASTAGGVIAAGAGVGVAGLGIAGAAMGDPAAFSAAWSDATSKIKAQFIDATRVFDGPGLDAVHSIGDAISHWDLKGLFASAVGYVQPLVSGAEAAAGYIFDGVKSLTADAGPAVAVLAKDLPDIGKSIGDALARIGSQSQGGADSLHALDSALIDIVDATGYVIAGSEAVVGGIADMTHAAQDFFGGIPTWVKVALPSLALFQGIFSLAPAKEGADNIAHFGQALQGVNVGLDGTVGKTDDLGVVGGHTFIGLDQQIAAAAATLDRMNASFDAAISNALGLQQADVQVAQGFADLNAQFEKGAGNLDINTQKGRDNISTIDGIVEGLQRQRDASIAAGDGSRAATDAANAAYDSQLAKLAQMLVKLGGNKKAVDDLLNSFHDKTFTITQKVVTVYEHIGSVSSQGVIAGNVPRTPGSAYAHGGIRHAAAGMIVPPRDPGTVLFGEPSTGGEALIPLGRSISDNGAMALASVVGAHHGFDVGRSTRVPAGLFGSGSGSGGGGTMRLEISARSDTALGSLLARMLRTGELSLTVVNGTVRAR